MLAVAEARARILAAASPRVSVRSVMIGQARGCVLAHDVRSACDVPPCDNSAMDGYALRSADVMAMGHLPVAGTTCAGEAPAILPAGSAWRILTGAPVPAGADAVVIQEDVDFADNRIVCKAGVAVRMGDNIRRAGEDIRSGDALFARGHRLRAVDVGLLASVGCAQVDVYARLRVGLLCTGDELREPGEPLQAGQIYNSNRYLLTALLQDLGCEVVDAGIVPDAPDATREALRDLAGRCDVLLSTGGVSVGDADYVRAAVEQLGELALWKIAMKPGKPFAFGRVGGQPFFGLPGNPVSAFVTFLLFVHPYLQRAAGADIKDLMCITAEAGFDWPRAGKREEYLRVQLQYRPQTMPCAIAYANQGSGVLSSVCWADALLRVPAGSTFAAGDAVECILLPN